MKPVRRLCRNPMQKMYFCTMLAVGRAVKKSPELRDRELLGIAFIVLFSFAATGLIIAQASQTVLWVLIGASLFYLCACLSLSCVITLFYLNRSKPRRCNRWF